MSDTGLHETARRIAIQLTADDLRHANMLHFLRQMCTPRAIIQRAAICCAGVTIIGLLLSLKEWRPPQLFPFLMAYLLSALAILTLPILSMLAFNGRASRKRFASYRPMQVPRVVDWNELAFDSRNEFGTVSIPWQDFVRSEENDRYLLIYTSEYYNIVPKHCLTDMQLQDLRRCMKTGNPKLVK